MTSGSIPTIVVVDFGMGNLGSIQNMLRYVGHTPPAFDSFASERAVFE